MIVARKGLSMTNTVIRIEELGKKYLLAHKSPQRYIALRDVLVDRAKRLGRRLRHPFARSAREENMAVEDFWALSDLSPGFLPEGFVMPELRIG